MVLSKEEMLDVFDGFDPSEYAQDAEGRWGQSDAYAQSNRRTNKYSKEDWARWKAEDADISQAFLELLASGTAPDSATAREVAERHRSHITKWFYDCSIEVHAGLGQMYVGDGRFTQSIDQAGVGLAAYMSEAIAANAAS